MVEESLLQQAAQVGSKKDDQRRHRLGAIGLRKDGGIVRASNGPVQGSPFPKAHAEARLCRKLDRGSIVFVARVNRLGDWCLARPCHHCISILKNHKVTQVYYTVSPGEYGLIQLRR